MDRESSNIMAVYIHHLIQFFSTSHWCEDSLVMQTADLVS